MKLIESYEDFKDDRWVHYTDHSMMTIASKKHSFHQDPSGIYFFPAKFEPNSFWKNKKNVFFVQIKPNSKVLDISKINEPLIRKLVQSVGATDEFESYIEQYPPKSIKKMMEMAWEQMRMKMMMNGPLWNKKLRELGYDAVFDDTGTIHSSEVQLLVLDPRILMSPEMKQQKYNAFQSMQKVVSDIVKVCEPFGNVTIEPPRSKTERWGTKKFLEAEVRVDKGADNYANFHITYNKDEPRHYINVSLRWSRPSLGYGSGLIYNLATKKYDHGDSPEKLIPDLEKIFSS